MNFYQDRFKTIQQGLAFSVFSLLLVNVSYADEPLPQYQPSKVEAQTLSAVGSDSMAQLMEQWVEGYQNFQPKVEVNLVSRGSALAPAALIEGSADLGPMARPMKELELESFQNRYGFQPTRVKTAIAAVGIYVSEENPLESISLAELDAIFSGSRKRGLEQSISTWAKVSRASKLGEISALGRSDSSLSNLFFRQQVLLQGDYSQGVTELPSMKAVFSSIISNPNAIAYGEVLDPPVGVKLLSVKKKGSAAVHPGKKTTASGKYPLSRFLNLYLVKGPGNGIAEGASDFLSYILSSQGQSVVKSHGLISLPAGMLDAERKKLD